MKPRLLIIDDDFEFTSDFMLLLDKDFKCSHASSGAAGIELLYKKSFDIVLLDLMLGNSESGLDVLKNILAFEEDLPVIMITDYASVNTAVEAIRLGAYDYISKTPNLNELKIIIDRSIQQKLLKTKARLLEEESLKQFYQIVGESPSIKNLKEMIRLFASNDNTVLITGESGVGKELVARQIHLKSMRREFPFVGINCAAIPKDLIESELFGHEKGAFTSADKRKIGKFELASAGTIFLDEISELDLKAQVKLLRILQEKEFERVGGLISIKTNVRIIAATNRNLQSLIEGGSFREDLFYRLNVLPIEVPPLRDRSEDIPLLVNHFTKQACIELKKTSDGFDRQAVDELCKYQWPGNIRELENFVTRAVILSKNNHIGLKDIAQNLLPVKHGQNFISKIPETWIEMDSMRKEAADKASREVEKIYLQNLLKKFNGNISKAAEYAGINRANLHKMIRKCNI